MSNSLPGELSPAAALTGLLAACLTVLACGGGSETTGPRPPAVRPDSIDPVITLWVQDTVTRDSVVVVHGRATDDRGMVSLYYLQSGGGTPTAIPLTSPKLTEFTLPFRWGDSPLSLVVAARDSSRNYAESSLLVWYDADPPWVAVVAPALAGAATQSLLVEAVDIRSGNFDGVVARISWQLDGGVEHLLASPNALAVDAVGPVPFDGSQTTVLVHVDDNGRNRATARAVVRRVPDIVSFSSGPMYNCAVDGAGAAWCWGRNGSGELGTGDTLMRDTPAQVAGAPPFASIAAGGRVTCGLSAAGEAYCWGVWTPTPPGGTAPPVLVPTLIAGGHHFTALTAGDSFACGLELNDGSAWCWGINDLGQLGTGDTVPSTAPRAVTGGLAFASFDAGLDHVCGLTGAGAAYCWGHNNTGQLGNGAFTDEGEVAPVPVSGGLAFRTIASGDWYSCAVTTGGAAWCWGYADAGRLGNEWGAGSFNTPQPVVDGHAFARIAAGNQRTCGVDTAGRMWCWGMVRDNGNASFHTWTDAVAYVGWPVRAAPGLTFQDVTVGAATCALSTERGLYCWGTGERAPLGNGP